LGAVERRVLHDRGDLIAQAVKSAFKALRLPCRATPSARGQSLALELVQQVRDGLAGGDGHIDGRNTAIEAVTDRGVTGDVAAHVLRDRVHRTLSFALATFKPELMWLWVVCKSSGFD
jgi:hypothetical protein